MDKIYLSLYLFTFIGLNWLLSKNEQPLFIIFSSSCCRSNPAVLLNSFPTGISNDELHFVLNAKSVFLQFTDLARNGRNPLSLQTIPQEASSELTFLLAAPFIDSLPLSTF